MAFKNNRSREPISAQAYNSIKRRILDLALKPGELLSETRLASEFGLSRTPVREALKRLENDGLVDVIPQQGTFVSPIRREFLMDAQFARTALECALVRAAAKDRNNVHLATLQANLQHQREAAADGDFDRLFKLDEEMHEALSIAAGRPNIWSLISDIKIHMDRARKLTLREDHIPRLLEQHQAIIDAVSNRDPDEAEIAMSRHLNFVVEHFDDFVSFDPSYTHERIRMIG